MPDMAAGGRAEAEAVRMLLKPEEDGGLWLGKQVSDLDSMTEIPMQKKKMNTKFMWLCFSKSFFFSFFFVLDIGQGHSNSYK